MVFTFYPVLNGFERVWTDFTGNNRVLLGFYLVFVSSYFQFYEVSPGLTGFDGGLDHQGNQQTENNPMQLLSN